jgi:hypothetical protein
MSVTAPQFADKDGYLAQVDRITHSHTLRKAESLCKLLRYLAERALTHPGMPLKEYQIATEVFGRSHDFDPQADSAIRVQAGRLRLKLLDYYSHEGLADTIFVEMPNGLYAINFQHREPPAPVAIPSPVQPEMDHRRRRTVLGAGYGIGDSRNPLSDYPFHADADDAVSKFCPRSPAYILE